MSTGTQPGERKVRRVGVLSSVCRLRANLGGRGGGLRLTPRRGPDPTQGRTGVGEVHNVRRRKGRDTRE